jgi:hypothetical protein
VQVADGTAVETGVIQAGRIGVPRLLDAANEIQQRSQAGRADAQHLVEAYPIR